MTAIFGLRTELPCICGACGRASSNVGSIEAPGVGTVLFVCDACKVTIGRKVLAMNTMKLDATESAAIKMAIGETAKHFVEAIFRVAFDNGFKSLDTLTPEQYTYLIGLVKVEMNGPAAALFVTYSNEIRRLIAVS